MAGAGLRLALVSNASVEIPSIFAETELAPFLDPTVFSCEEHLMKPDPAIFQVALDGLGMDAPVCAFVGDGFGRELSGSSAVGMRAIQIAVAGESYQDVPDFEGHTWTGERVSALSELPGLLGIG
jgi:putative hydrolase of the HAD superfamily